MSCSLQINPQFGAQVHGSLACASNNACTARRLGALLAGTFILQNAINKSKSWYVQRSIPAEFSLFTTISGYEMAVYIITGEQEELFTLRLMSEGGASPSRVMSPLFETQ